MVSANIVDSGSDAEGGNSDDDEQEDDLPELYYTHKKLQSEFDRLALNEEDTVLFSFSNMYICLTFFHLW